MKNEDYHKTIIVNASAAEAIQKINQVDQWWAKQVKGKSQQLNDRFTVDFGATFVDFQISALVPSQKVVWKVTDCNLHWIDHKKEWNGTEVVFEVSSVDKHTKIDFTHVGLIPSAECYENCEAGWTEHIGHSLLKFLNEGQGMPM